MILCKSVGASFLVFNLQKKKAFKLFLILLNVTLYLYAKLVFLLFNANKHIFYKIKVKTKFKNSHKSNYDKTHCVKCKPILFRYHF